MHGQILNYSPRWRIDTALACGCTGIQRGQTYFSIVNFAESEYIRSYLYCADARPDFFSRICRYTGFLCPSIISFSLCSPVNRSKKKKKKKKEGQEIVISADKHLVSILVLIYSMVCDLSTRKGFYLYNYTR